MTSSYPGALDSFTDPVASDTLGTTGVKAFEVIALLHDAVEKLEAKVGADSSAVTTSHDYILATDVLKKALADAKGDLLVATAADTIARLAVGTDGHVLTADSGEATGMKWAAGGSGTSALELAHAQTTSAQTGIGTSITDLTGLSITPTIGANPVIVEGLVRFQMKVAAQPVIAEIYDSTSATVIYQTAVSLGIDQYGLVYMKARVAPAAGARTYKLRARTQLSNTCETQSAATSPAFIRCHEVMT